MTLQAPAAFSDCGARTTSADASIHEKAHVDGAAIIGNRTTIWQFASVIRGARIGERCTVSAYALIDSAVIGDDCLISSGAQLHPGTNIGCRVFVGPGAIFCNDLWPSTSKEGFRGDLLQRGFVTTRVFDGAAIGAHAVVLPGVTIGKRAMVAANATARHSVPDDYLLRRDGSMVPIRPEWREKRMIEA